MALLTVDPDLIHISYVTILLPLRNQTLSLSLRLKAEPRALPPEAHGGGTAVIHEDYLNPFNPGSFNSYDLLSLKFNRNIQFTVL